MYPRYLKYARALAKVAIGVAMLVPDSFPYSSPFIDEIMPVSDELAYKFGADFAKKEGVLVGISSGAALVAAKLIAGRSENANKNIVVILPDTGTRYLSTPNYF